MSNRKRLASEKGVKIRCPKCRSRDFLTKLGGYNVHVCQRCEHIWPAQSTCVTPPGVGTDG